MGNIDDLFGKEDTSNRKESYNPSKYDLVKSSIELGLIGSVVGASIISDPIIGAGIMGLAGAYTGYFGARDITG